MGHGDYRLNVTVEGPYNGGYNPEITDRDSTLKLTQFGDLINVTREVAITDLSWQREKEITQLPDAPGKRVVLAEGAVSYTGTFTLDGQYVDLRLFITDKGSTSGFGGPFRGTISVRERIAVDPITPDDAGIVNTIRFEDCRINRTERTYSSGETTQTSYEWISPKKTDQIDLQ